MLSYLSSRDIVIVNFALMIVWHFLILVICRALPNSTFRSDRRIYIQKKWENDGKFYVKTLKIKKWKDRLPQFVARKGFSKKHFIFSKNVNAQYINTFISETCRAEWNHLMCSMYFIISFAVNSLWYAIAFSIIPVIANLPFLIIQRYNRIRLIRFNEKNVCQKFCKAQN